MYYSVVEKLLIGIVFRTRGYPADLERVELHTFAMYCCWGAENFEPRWRVGISFLPTLVSRTGLGEESPLNILHGELRLFPGMYELVGGKNVGISG